MNEIEIVFLGLLALVISVLLLRVFEASEIIEDKEVEIATALRTGLYKCGFHEKIHRQHDIIDENDKKIHEQNELILDIGNNQNEYSIEE